MREIPIVAVDPGGRRTGIIVRSLEGLHRWTLITKTTSLDEYLAEVVAAVTETRHFARTLLLDANRDDFREPIVAVEDLNPPTPQMGLTSVQGLLDTAQVLGAIAGHFNIIRVPPGGHGDGPLVGYPEPLRSGTEKIGKGKLVHCRSAWDIAATARTLLRTEATR